MKKTLFLLKPLKISISLSNDGQTVVEFMFTFLFVVSMLLGIFQITHLIIAKVTAFDAVNAACRSKIVNKNPQLAAYYVLQSQQMGTNIIPVITAKSNDGMTTTEISYLHRIIIPAFSSITGMSWLPNKVICSRVQPPEPEYFYKSYKYEK